MSVRFHPPQNRPSTNVANVSNAVQAISSSFGHRPGRRSARGQGRRQARQMAENAGKAMNDLDKSSSEISKLFYGDDQMIALQTNLLALNATIEATSAGEAGRASPWLHMRSKNSPTKAPKPPRDIAKKIEDVQGRARQAVGVIREIGEVIKSINQSPTEYRNRSKGKVVGTDDFTQRDRSKSRSRTISRDRSPRSPPLQI